MKSWLWLPLTLLMLSPVLWERIGQRVDGVAEGGSGFPPSYSEGGSGFPPSYAEGGSGFPTK